MVVVEIDRIREAFSKATVTFSSDGLSIFYTDDGFRDSFGQNWINQCFDDATLETIKDVFLASDWFCISIRPNEHIHIFFFVPEKTDGITVYPPLKKERRMSTEEILARIPQPEDEERRAEIERYRSLVKAILNRGGGVDPNDIEETKSRVLEILELHNEFFPFSEEPVKLQSVAKLNKMISYLTRIQSLGFVCDIDVQSPDTTLGYAGCVTFSVCETDLLPGKISGEIKEILLQFFELSESVSIEAEPGGGYLNITFFP